MLRRSLLALSFVSVPFFAPVSTSAATRFAPDQVLVIVRDQPGVTRSSAVPEAVRGPIASLGLEVDRTLARASVRRAWSLFRLRSTAAGFDPVAAAATLRATPGVVAAIPNYTLKTFDTFPNDPMR